MKFSRFTYLLSGFFVFFLLFFGIFRISAQEESRNHNQVCLIRIDGAISPLTVNYIERGIKTAKRNGSGALIIELDTPGGMLESTKQIVQQFLESEGLPIIVYVSPQGGSATSAGTFITLAAHAAVMAPATTIGAASPIQMGGGGPVQMDSVMQKKLFRFTESFMESIAKERNRNVEWAVSAVTEGASITSEKALELGVIDFIATDRQDLLEKLNGFSVQEDELQTLNAQIVELEPNLAERFLSVLIRPEVILILTMLAIYGIVGEITNPGALVPGIGGAVSLILVLYASSAIPINTAGFLLVLLAVGLFIAEAFTPTFGILIAGGAVSFFLGVLMLFQDLPESMSISFGWLIPATILMVLFFIWVAYEGIRVQFKSNVSGVNYMIGKTAKVIDEVNATGGRVFVMGEYWNAYSDEVLHPGEKCIVLEVENLTLKVGKPTEANQKQLEEKKNN